MKQRRFIASTADKVFKIDFLALVILDMKKLFSGFFIDRFFYLPAILQKKHLLNRPINLFQFSVQKKIICGNGAVVSAHPLASKVGLKF